MAWFAFGPMRRIFRRCGSDLVCACYSDGINKKDTEGKEYSPSALIRLERFMNPPGIRSRLDIASRRPGSTTSVVRVLVRKGQRCASSTSILFHGGQTGRTFRLDGVSNSFCASCFCSAHDACLRVEWIDVESKSNTVLEAARTLLAGWRRKQIFREEPRD
jgi:hypothetical protein